MDATNGYLRGISDGPDPCVGGGCCSDCSEPADDESDDWTTEGDDTRPLGGGDALV